MLVCSINAYSMAMNAWGVGRDVCCAADGQQRSTLYNQIHFGNSPGQAAHIMLCLDLQGRLTARQSTTRCVQMVSPTLPECSTPAMDWIQYRSARTNECTLSQLTMFLDSSSYQLKAGNKVSCRQPTHSG